MAIDMHEDLAVTAKARGEAERAAQPHARAESPVAKAQPKDMPWSTAHVSDTKEEQVPVKLRKDALALAGSLRKAHANQMKADVEKGEMAHETTHDQAIGAETLGSSNIQEEQVPLKLCKACKSNPCVCTAKAFTPADTISDLNARTLELKSLGLAVHVAHVNCTGPNFLALHEFFGNLYEDLLTVQADKLMERVRAMGGTAMGSAMAVAGTILPDPAQFGDAILLARAVRVMLHTVLDRLRETRASVANSDLDTFRVLDDIIHDLNKPAWFLDEVTVEKSTHAHFAGEHVGEGGGKYGAARDAARAATAGAGRTAESHRDAARAHAEAAHATPSSTIGGQHARSASEHAEAASRLAERAVRGGDGSQHEVAAQAHDAAAAAHTGLHEEASPGSAAAAADHKDAAAAIRSAAGRAERAAASDHAAATSMMGTEPQAAWHAEGTKQPSTHEPATRDANPLVAHAEKLSIAANAASSAVGNMDAHTSRSTAENVKAHVDAYKAHHAAADAHETAAKGPDGGWGKVHEQFHDQRAAQHREVAGQHMRAVTAMRGQTKKSTDWPADMAADARKARVAPPGVDPDKDNDPDWKG